MTQAQATLTSRRLKTPRAAAISGIAFALLMGASQVLIRLSVPPDSLDSAAYLASRANTIGLALKLVPFAGIAFLWFIGAVRDRLGQEEDQFFSTVFQGAGVLYLAMYFVAAALAGGLLAISARDPALLEGGVYPFGRMLTLQINSIYAVRMSGVFMLSLATIWTRTETMPRWAALVTYALALVLLLSISLSMWVTLIFPVWVFLISVYVLISGYGGWLGETGSTDTQ
jgi:hypothetical protein